MEKCSLIHESKLREVEQLIYYLQNRRTNDTNTGNVAHLSSAPSYFKNLLHFKIFIGSDSSHPPRPASSNSMITENSEIERAVISNVDSYIELLYEEIPGKIKGSSLILQLARIPDNLLELTKNGIILYILLYTFLCIYNFMNNYTIIMSKL